MTHDPYRNPKYEQPYRSTFGQMDGWQHWQDARETRQQVETSPHWCPPQPASRTRIWQVRLARVWQVWLWPFAWRLIPWLVMLAVVVTAIIVGP